MKRYADMTADQRREEYAAVRKAYEAQKALGLKLNMARGKPSTEQLDMVTREMAQLTRPEDYLAGGLDTRTMASWRASRRHGRCLPRYWAAGRSRCSSAATPACS